MNTITDAVGRVLDFDYDPMFRVDDLRLPDLPLREPTAKRPGRPKYA